MDSEYDLITVDFKLYLKVLRLPTFLRLSSIAFQVSSRWKGVFILTINDLDVEA